MKPITIVGHRGARGEAPENTLAGFIRARELALDEVELDLHLSADSELIVLHDPTLKRTTGVDSHRRHFSSKELQALDARHSFPRWPEPTGIPRLIDVLNVSSPSLRFQLEVKADAMPAMRQLAHRLAAVIEQQRLADRVVVTSLNIDFLNYFGHHFPNYQRGYICQYRHHNPVKRAKRLGTQWLMLNYKMVTPLLLKKAAQSTLKVSVWTVNDIAVAERLVAMGVNNIITDFPSAFQHHFHHVSL